MNLKYNPTMLAATQQRFILALDMPSRDEAERIIDMTKDYVGYYKIGLGFLANHGIEFARELAEQGFKIFLDLKLFDISQTITDTVARLSEKTQASLMTIHGDHYVVSSAIKGRQLSGCDTLELYAVTILTSLELSDLISCGYQTTSIIETVIMRAKHAAHAGADGVIASAHEVSSVKGLGYGLKVITPGVRSVGVVTNDQKRVMTPFDALKHGSDKLVIGREVTHAESPKNAAEKIFDAIMEFNFTTV